MLIYHLFARHVNDSVHGGDDDVGVGRGAASVEDAIGPSLIRIRSETSLSLQPLPHYYYCHTIRQNPLPHGHYRVTRRVWDNFSFI